MISSYIGAGKTTLSRAPIPLLQGPLSYVEGDTFGSFMVKSEKRSRRQNFR
jgi:hypothetical protein